MRHSSKPLFLSDIPCPRDLFCFLQGSSEDKADLLHSCQLLKEMDFVLYATKGTHDYLKENGIDSIVVHWPDEAKEPNIMEFVSQKKADLVINIPKSFDVHELTNDYKIRRMAIDYNIPLITNVQIAKLFIRSISMYKEKDLLVKSWREYREGDNG